MISCIVAMDQNRVIGYENALPWHLPADLAYFKKVTMGHPIIMGRKTFESIGRVLPGRENIVVTRNTAYEARGCTVVHDIRDIFSRFSTSEEEVFLIGGAQLFEEALPIAERLYLTTIDATFRGDVFFPVLSATEWDEISCEQGIQDEKNPYSYQFRIYERKN